MGLEAAEKSKLVLGLLLGTGGHTDRHKGERRQHVTHSSSSKLPKCSQGLGESLWPCGSRTRQRPQPYSCSHLSCFDPGVLRKLLPCPPQGGPQCHKEPKQTVLPDTTERLSYHKANLEMRGVEALLQAVAWICGPHFPVLLWAGNGQPCPLPQPGSLPAHQAWVDQGNKSCTMRKALKA